MTEKRYFVHKHLFRENKVHDKICHNFMSLDETVEHMNNQYWKYKQLKEENEQLKHRINDYNIALKKLQDLTERKINENEQLKHKLKSLNDNFNHLKRLFDEIEEPISDELLAEYSRIVGEDLND